MRARLRLLAIGASAVIASTAQAESQQVGGCAVFPADNIWNTPIDTLPVDPRSDAYIASIGAETGLKTDFGSGLYEGAPIGIPYVVVPFRYPRVDIVLAPFDGEGPMPKRATRAPHPFLQKPR